MFLQETSNRRYQTGFKSLNEIDKNNKNEKELKGKSCECIQLHSAAIQSSTKHNHFKYFFPIKFIKTVIDKNGSKFVNL